MSEILVQSMSPKLNIVIVGAGNISEEYLKVINDLKNINISHIFSKTKKKILKKKEKYKIEDYSTSFKEFSNFLDTNKPDGIIIAVSVKEMFNTVKNILPFKIPLLIEKPPCLSLQELKSLVKISKKYQTKNMIGLNRRYYSHFINFFKDLKNNKIDSIYIEGHENIWKINHSKSIINKWLYANSIHTLDLLFYFTSSTPKKINITKIKNQKYLNFNCSILFKNNIYCNYSSNWNNYGRWSVSINAGDDKYVFKPLESGIKIKRNGRILNLKRSQYDKKYKPGFYNQINAFSNLIKNKRNQWPDVSLNDLTSIFTLIKKIS